MELANEIFHQIYKRLLIDECEVIKNERIKQFAIAAIEMLPEYFFTASASASGKYHPQYTLGEGGLARHTLAAVKIALHLLALEQYKGQFTDDECDCMIAALLLHDGWKQGNSEEQQTVHGHPEICANWIMSEKAFRNMLYDEHRKLVSKCIATHMGEWTVSDKSPVVLKKPSSKAQKFVHMCDYLASRKDVEIVQGEKHQCTCGPPTVTGRLIEGSTLMT